MNCNIANIKASLSGEPNIFKLWLEFTRPMNKLSRSQINLLAFLLRNRYEMMKLIHDEKEVESLLFSPENRAIMCEELGINKTTLITMLSVLRTRGVLFQNNTINPKYIPCIGEDSDTYKLIINFNINE